MKASAVLMCLSVTLALAAGQVLFKQGALQISGAGFWERLIQALTNAYLLAGLALYGVTTMAWVWVLTQVPLSRAYPFTALAFVIVPVAAHYLFGEAWHLQLLIGSLLIVAGIIVIGSA